MTAKMAGQARHMMMQRHAVSGTPSFHAIAGRDDGPGGLMPENPRRRQAAETDFFDVGGADAADRDAHQ